MKKSLCFTVSLFISSLALKAQIQFVENVPFATILEQAKKENKLIFVDCYTTWCVPCKELSKRIFTDKTLGDRYNEWFINYKLDTEKGEGPVLAKTFKIEAFPTLLWIDTSGEVVHRTVGSNTVDFFLNTIELVQDQGNRYFDLAKRFQAGDRSPELLKKLTRFATITHDLNGRPYIEAYFESIPEAEWLSAENRASFYAACTSFDSKLMRYVLANLGKFEHDTVENLKTTCLDIANRLLIRSRSEEELQKFLALVDTYTPERLEYRKASELDFYMNVGNQAKLNELTSRYLKNWEDAYILSVYSWQRSVSETDTTLLKEAIGWAKRAIKLEEDDWNTATLGQLYQKTGKPKKAAKWFKRSKELEERQKQNG